ncbi:hypothetical protein B0J12DRAFT_643169 [Macrophomina phaseolina]|uniref:Uncharacterized protein n=1 Tax=Macrophomina phaseolina TaxID=35725 RepID=A0ABQ8GVH8_9PEZI|nr:hypothetical protein B0J12DRAFT_643169 [Macrophomina phaseolina]
MGLSSSLRYQQLLIAFVYLFGGVYGCGSRRSLLILRPLASPDVQRAGGFHADRQSPYLLFLPGYIDSLFAGNSAGWSCCRSLGLQECSCLSPDEAAAQLSRSLEATASWKGTECGLVHI